MSRPKRESAQRAASQTSVLFWNEERDLKKALHASLVEARRKARIAVKEKERVKEQEKHKEKESNHCDITVSNKVKCKSNKLKKAELPVASLTTFSSAIIAKEKVCTLENNDNSINNLKKARIPAQRKFAQGSSNNTPISSPIKVSYCVPTVTQEMFTKVKPTAADFLTFLCLRDTSILPERLDLEALNKESESEPLLDTNDVKESNNSKSEVDIINSSESPIKNVPQNALEESINQCSEKTLMNKIEALKVKYKLQRLAKKSSVSTNVAKVKEVSVIGNVNISTLDEKTLNKTSDEEASKSKKLNSSLTKLNEAKSNITSNTTQRVLRSHHNPSDEGAFKLSLPSINCLCKSSEPLRSPSKPNLKKFKRSISPITTSRSHERKAKPAGLVDYHLEIEDCSDVEYNSRGKDKLFTKRDRELQSPKLKVIPKPNKKDTKDSSSTNVKNVLTERILRNRHCLVQNTTHMKSPPKSVNKCQIKFNSLTKDIKRTKVSPERRPNRKAKPNAPLIDYHIEIEGESDVEIKKSIKEKEQKQKVETRASSPMKKTEALKHQSVVLTRTQMPILKQQVKTCVKEQIISKRTVVKNKSKAVTAPEKRVTRSLSNASKKDEEAAKEREKEIKRKILEVEKRQKQRMARHASESSLHSTSSSDSLSSSVSSSSSINIPRITRSLEQLKKLRKELKKNKQKMLNGSLFKKSSTGERSTIKKKLVSKNKKVVEMRSFSEKSTSTPKSKVKSTQPKTAKNEIKAIVNLKSRRRKCAQHQTSGEDITKALQTMAEGLNSSDDHCVPDLAYCDSAPIQGLMTREFSGAFAEETVSTASAMLLPSSSTCSFAQTSSHVYAQTSDANQKATVDAATNTTEEEIAFSVSVSDSEKNSQSPMEELSVGTQTITPVGSPESETVEELRIPEPVVERSSRSKSGRNGLKY